MKNKDTPPKMLAIRLEDEEVKNAVMTLKQEGYLIATVVRRALVEKAAKVRGDQ